MPRVYVGNLPVDIRESELEDLFYKYGRIREIDIKRPPRPPAFAFISYDDIRDAEDAVYARDGYNFDGCRLRCELSKDTGGRFGGGRGGYDDRGRGGYGRDDGFGQRGRGGGKRTEFGVLVTNLPRSTSWQDLKDFFRKAGDVVYTDVNNNTGDGIVEFSNREDMEQAIDKLDDTEFKNRYDAAFIRVKRPPNATDRDRSPVRRDERDRSRSRSRDRNERDRKEDDDDDRREDKDKHDKAKHDDEEEDKDRVKKGDKGDDEDN